MSQQGGSPTVIPAEGHRFLNWWFRNAEGQVDLRAITKGEPPVTGRLSLPVSGPALSVFVNRNIDRHLYFGVATRGPGESGGLDNVLSVPGLWVDVDDRKGPGSEPPLEPSAVVASGGGTHLYWRLKTPASAAQVAPILRGLTAACEGDMACAEPARILRLPGTWNSRWEKPCRIVSMNGPEYDLSAFDAFRSAPVAAPPAGPQDLKSELLPADLLPETLERCKALREIMAGTPGHQDRVLLADLALNFEGGNHFIHQFLARFPGYSPAETDKQLRSLRGKPPLCSTLCPASSCAAAGRYRSPIGIAYDLRREARMQALTRTESAAPSISVSDYEIVSLTNFNQQDFGRLEYLLSPVLAHPCRGILAGYAGLGKTSLLADVLYCVSNGLPVIGLHPERPLRVLYLDAENEQSLIQRNTRIMTQVRGGSGDNFFRVSTKHKPLNLLIPQGRETLSALIDKTSAEVVVLDSFLGFFPVRDENASSEVRPALDAVSAVVQPKGTKRSLLIIDHASKPKSGSGKAGDVELLSARGSGAKRDWCDSMLVLTPGTRKVGGKMVRSLNVPKSRATLLTEPIIISMDDSFTWEVVEEGSGARAITPHQLLDVVRCFPGVPAKEVVSNAIEVHNCSERSVWTALSVAQNLGLIEKRVSGRNVLYVPVTK